MTELEYFTYDIQGFYIYQYLYCFKKWNGFEPIYELTYISGTSLRDLIDFYSGKEVFPFNNDIRRVKNSSNKTSQFA